LSEKGSYHPSAIYTHADITRVVRYAALRGIRVVPEYDVPGHAASWGNHYPVVATCPPNRIANINNHPLNPALNLTYEIMNGILDESAQLFPDQNVHLGADEVVKSCWTVDQSIKDFMKWRGYGDNLLLLQAYFFTRVEPMYRAHKKIPIFWDELFMTQNEYKIPTDSIIEAWRGHDILIKSIKAGYMSLLAHGFYLDKQQPLGRPRYSMLDNWHDFYENEPFRNTTLTVQEQKRVLGGEGAIWTEQVDELNLDASIWPRTSAIAERLWSEQKINSPTLASARLELQRCRNARRGIRASPVLPGKLGYCDAAYKY
jgi:hexosaminidase